MTLETKPIAQLKMGVWVNREKMRNSLNKLSLFYGIFLGGLAIFNLMDGMVFLGVIELLMALPLGLIQWSYIKYKKMESKNEKK